MCPAIRKGADLKIIRDNGFFSSFHPKQGDNCTRMQRVMMSKSEREREDWEWGALRNVSKGTWFN